VLWCTSARAERRPVLELCVERPGLLAAELRDQVGAARVRPRPLRACRGRPAADYRGQFARASGQVVFGVTTRTGRTLTRAVPWVSRPEGALASLAVRGRLAALAIVIDGLLIEERLEQVWTRFAARERSLVELAAAPKPPASNAPEERASTDGALQLASGSRSAPRATALLLPGSPGSLAADEPRMAALIPAPPEPEAPAAAPASTEETSKPGPSPSPAPVAATASRPSPSAARSVATPVSAPSAPRAAMERVPAVRAAAGGRASLLEDLALAAQAGGRWRDPEIFGWEVDASLSWRFLFVGAGYQPAASWELEGRTLELTAVPIRAGWRHVLWASRRWLVVLTVAAVVERLTVQRVDLPRSAAHPFWDVGLGSGVVVARRLAGDLWLGLGLDAALYVPGREVEVPDGPSARLNLVSLRPALTLLWDRQGKKR
jgi:hypothetical protein